MELLSMENSTKIKAVLTAILAAALGGDEALTAAWHAFSTWAFANVQGTDLAEIGGFKIAAVTGMGLYLFWRKRTGQIRLRDPAALRQALRALAEHGGDAPARRQGGGYQPTATAGPAAPPGNPPNQGSGAITPSKETET
jgi:hypothetical protein